MKCGICKADMEEMNVTYTEDIEHGVVVIRHVPAHVCTECGNTWYSVTVARELENLIDRFASAVGTEVSVVDYSRLVA